MYKVDLALRKKMRLSWNVTKKSVEHLSLLLLKILLSFPKEQHIYTANCGNCKKAIAVKAKELLSF